MTALTAELGELLAHDHARITAAITAARYAADESEDELGACDRAVAALSQHAAVMSTRAYPMARHVLSGPDRGVVSLITLLRRPAGHSLTRPHPLLLRGGWPIGLAIRAQYRIDQWRDVLDSRVSWRTGG